ncbi:MAG: hypothetical protein GY856_14930 [bacterium]|nr:hypothetical protein [bacterium]
MMSDQSKAPAEGLRLARYIVLLVLDQRRLDFYVNSKPEKREEEMKSAGLSKHEIALITTACFEKLCAYLREAGVAPAPYEDPDPGGLAPTS